MLLRFVCDCELEITTDYDEENDTASTVNEMFSRGEEHEVDVIDSNDETTDFQFGDGSMAYGVSNQAFVEFTRLDDGVRHYDNYRLQDGRSVQGTDKYAIVINPSVYHDYVQYKFGGENAFFECLKFATGIG